MSGINRVRKILEQNIYCTVSTAGNDGRPWGSPVFFGFDDQIIYWRSWPESVHSHNLALRPEAFVTVFDSHASWGEGTGVYMEGDVRKIEDAPTIEKALSVMNPRSKKISKTSEFLPPNPRRVYAFTPRKIWLNEDKEINGQFVDIRSEVVA